MVGRVKTGEVWLNCSGMPMLHDLPLHPVVQEQVDKGQVQVVPAPEHTPAPVDQQPATESTSTPTEFVVTDHTAAEVAAHLDAIADAGDRQFEALRLAEDERQAEKPRTTLLAKLDAVAGD